MPGSARAGTTPTGPTHRVDIGPAYPAACRLRLPHSRAMTDRFHVAKKFHEVADGFAKSSLESTEQSWPGTSEKPFGPNVSLPHDAESLSAKEKPTLEALFEKSRR